MRKIKDKWKSIKMIVSSDTYLIAKYDPKGEYIMSGTMEDWMCIDLANAIIKTGQAYGDIDQQLNEIFK